MTTERETRASLIGGEPSVYQIDAFRVIQFKDVLSLGFVNFGNFLLKASIGISYCHPDYVCYLV